MNIGGFQPLSLLDYPGKPCSIIFTQGCVFRCSYCHNPDLIPLESVNLLDERHVLEFLEKRKKIVDAVCITGGEPTIQKGLLDMMKTLKEKGLAVKLDTNGIRPAVVEDIIEEELVDYIAMDIKAPWERYSEVSKNLTTPIIEACKESMRIIQESGVDHEFRTTIAPGVHTEEDFTTMAGYLKSGGIYYIQKIRFEKTLDPDLVRDMPLDVTGLILQLKSHFPSLYIHER